MGEEDRKGREQRREEEESVKDERLKASVPLRHCVTAHWSGCRVRRPQWPPGLAGEYGGDLELLVRPSGAPTLVFPTLLAAPRTLIFPNQEDTLHCL